MIEKIKNKKQDFGFKTNYQIKSPQMKLVGDNVTMGVYSFKEAIAIADGLNLDLVEISPNQSPPICKIMDYEKFIYDKKKNEKKSDKVKTKELRFTPSTGNHDLEFKIKHAKSFLEKGNRVKMFVLFKGREMKYQDQGAEIIKKIVDALEDIGIVESDLKIENNKMIVFFKPKKK